MPPHCSSSVPIKLILSLLINSKELEWIAFVLSVDRNSLWFWIRVRLECNGVLLVLQLDTVLTDNFDDESVVHKPAGADAIEGAAVLSNWGVGKWVLTFVWRGGIDGIGRASGKSFEVPR